MKQFAHGLVLGKFWPLHAGHQRLIDTALERCERVTVQLLAHPEEDVPLEVRAGWIRSEHPDAHLVTAYDLVPVDFEDPAIWDAHMSIVHGLLDAPVDATFTSDPYGEELARRFGATWVQVDPGRREVPVSGTQVREDPDSTWWALPGPVRTWYARRAVVVGAESTGTTTLSQDLATALGTTWVPEYGRQWSEERPGGLATPWTTDEFDHVAARQLELESEAVMSSPSRWVVCDTDVLATAVWHERYVGTRSASLEDLVASRKPTCYVLTDCDIPFVQDGLRDGEHLRSWMTDRFREVLDAGDVPWLAVRGSRSDRVDQVLRWLPGPAERPHAP